MSYNYISKLDDETAKNLKEIHRYSVKKWFKGEVEEQPFAVDIVRELINGLYEIMKEEGKL